MCFAGDKLQLQGLCAFDAAVHCASMSSSTSARNGTPGGKQQQRAGPVQRIFQRLVNRFLLMPGSGELQAV
jgi:hypothetical protein